MAKKKKNVANHTATTITADNNNKYNGNTLFQGLANNQRHPVYSALITILTDNNCFARESIEDDTPHFQIVVG